MGKNASRFRTEGRDLVGEQARMPATISSFRVVLSRSPVETAKVPKWRFRIPWSAKSKIRLLTPRGWGKLGIQAR